MTDEKCATTLFRARLSRLPHGAGQLGLGARGVRPTLGCHTKFCVSTLLADQVIEQAASFPLLCRFSDAGMTMLSTRYGGRRPKSAKARNRGKWGTGGAAGAMEI
ncbi:hypothetical protein [Bradyrhizobium sp. AUGA SZCCT0283]|uniref:hypothetical protein n=1 Tax=Bradyrhizobium sp. AUGA SZCCT0283 TaxID=2807671 RepID=UPI001BA8DBFF|nr:hypothetical protein [Bradyrhizobium sp. AUGA SZCCT0283]MBR1275613.1 hypothetical protein [Bradyrhizobium sp. AUGA SZCCT0283]